MGPQLKQSMKAVLAILAGALLTTGGPVLGGGRLEPLAPRPHRVRPNEQRGERKVRQCLRQRRALRAQD